MRGCPLVLACPRVHHLPSTESDLTLLSGGEHDYQRPIPCERSGPLASSLFPWSICIRCSARDTNLTRSTVNRYPECPYKNRNDGYRLLSLDPTDARGRATPSKVREFFLDLSPGILPANHSHCSIPK